MKRLLTTLVMVTALLDSAGMARADAESDFDKGWAASKRGDQTEAVKWYRKAADQGHPDAKKLQNEAEAKIAAANRTESERLAANARHEAAEQRRASEARRAAEAAKT